MDEDSVQSNVERTMLTEYHQKVITHPEQNGVLVVLDGQPLVGEFFSNPIGLKRTLKETLRAVSFDATLERSNGISSDEVHQFFFEIGRIKNHEIDSDHWGAVFAGGTFRIDTRISVNQNEEILYFSTINRNHRVLLGV